MSGPQHKVNERRFLVLYKIAEPTEEERAEGLDCWFVLPAQLGRSGTQPMWTKDEARVQLEGIKADDVHRGRFAYKMVEVPLGEAHDPDYEDEARGMWRALLAMSDEEWSQVFYSLEPLLSNRYVRGAHARYADLREFALFLADLVEMAGEERARRPLKGKLP